MGWDAAATKRGQMLALGSSYRPEFWSIGDLPFREVFEAAQNRVRDAVGQAPEYLATAELSGSKDRMMFERVFGIRFAEIPDGELEWSADELLQRFARAQWLMPDNQDDMFSYWTVKEFVTACVGNGLGVHCCW